MKYLIFLLLWCGEVQAEVTQLSLDVRKFGGAIRDPYYPGKDDFENYVGLNWDLMGFQTLTWENTVYFYGDDAQVRKVGWHFDVGLKLNEYFTVIHNHQSDHDVDHDRNDPQFGNRPKFPLQNSYGLRFNFLGK